MNKRFLISAIIIALAGFVGFTGFLFVRETTVAPLPVLGQVAEFSLLDADGKAFSSERLRDKIWVADFIFTTCGSICPVMTRNMAALQRSYALEEDVRFVSVTVNPENDTPERLSRFARNYEADRSRWYFLTGPRADITRLAVESFKIGSVEEPVFHSAYFVLVDREGRIRGYYDGTQERDVQRIFKHLAYLNRQ